MILSLRVKTSVNEWMFGYRLVFNGSRRTPELMIIMSDLLECQLLRRPTMNLRVQGHKVYVASIDVL